MNRPGQTSRIGLVFFAAFAAIAVGAVLIVRYWPNAKSSTNPPPAGPGPTVVTPPSVDESPLPAPGKVVQSGETVQVPFIFWGGDVATFVANGGLDTTKESRLGRQGLSIHLTPGDDFDKQVKAYLDNKSPFLRGTLSMLGQASDQLTAKPETVPVVFLQLTWSAGDHLVGRSGFKTLNDLKGKKIALQKGGPHVGMLNDCLRTAQLEWKDIKIVWTDDVSGDKGPAALFRKDPTIDGCFAISPEMSDLAGGLDSTGNGDMKSVQGAHVVVSTAYMSHSIADVYACRADFYAANREWVEKFAAGYLKSCEELVDAKKKKAPAYQAAIHMAQDVWGKDPTLKDSVAKEDDVDGLISDSTFVGLPGNIAFFTSKGNLAGYPFKMAQALALPDDPATQEFKTTPKGFRQAGFDYDALRKRGDLNGKAITQGRISPEFKFDDVKETTIYSFKIGFEADKYDFPESQYGKDYQRALEEASLFGNTVVAIRGHAQPAALIDNFLKASVDNGILRHNDANNSYIFAADGKPLDLNNMASILDAIQKHPTLTYADDNGRRRAVAEQVQALQVLSDKRAKAVRDSIIAFAKSKGLVLDESQMRSQGVGVREPLYTNPANDDQSGQNRRVEFSIIKVPAEKVQADEFGL
ncbi:MAG TPA: ABC transporter substrate-binding protein [Gemmataceae bacterium]|nr:ABC transporter substrate-binding protein [Gemmataceae bacterium]